MPIEREPIEHESPARSRGAAAAPGWSGAPLSRRTFLRLGGVTGLAALTATGAASAYAFDVVEVSAAASGLRDPVRVAFLTDLHYGPLVREASVTSWVDAALDLAPDLIVLGGDVVDALAPSDLTPLLLQLARLRAPLGVYAVSGNHEYSRFGSLRLLRAALWDAGVRVLADEGALLRDDLYLAGVDTGRGYGRVRVEAALAGQPARSACLLASHKPDVLPRVPDTVDLTLCGHTHGGQIRIPGVGAIVTRTALGQAGTQGFVRAPALGYVSRGLGVVHVPLRLNCPAELTIVTLLPA